MGITIPAFILLLGPLLGVFIYFKLKPKNNKIISNTVLFSGAFLLGVAVFGLMPELFHNIKQAGIWLIFGFLFQLFLERFTGGIGHGHIHSHEIPKNIWVLYAGLYLHALFEGYSAGLSNYLTPYILSSMVIGISIHETPAAFSLSLLLKQKLKIHRNLVLAILFYVLATPVGYTLGVYIHSENIISDNVSQIITAIIAGTFLHISTTIVFETTLWKKEGLSKWIFILGGLIISYLACLVG
jgi:zinc and cadmium transporter